MRNIGFFLFFALNLCIVDCRLSAEFVPMIKENGLLNSCLKHNLDGYFCFDGSKFQSSYTQKGTTYYNDFIDGKKYSYKMQSLDVDMYLMFSDSSNRKLVDVNTRTSSALKTLKGIKYACTVERASSPVNIKDIDVLETHDDGSKVLKVDHWIISFDKEGVPTSISVMDDEISVKDDEPNEPFVYISGKHSFSSFLKKDISGCDPATEGDIEPKLPEEVADLYHRTLLANDPSISEEEYFSIMDMNKENSSQDDRKLADWFTEFQQWASGTFWCGSGTHPQNTPCPDPWNTDPDYDYEADHACRRHDHGSKHTYEYFGQLIRLECSVDKDLMSASDNPAIQAVYGEWSPFGALVGCWNWETYWCWKGWWWTSSCGPDWDVNYGPWRYDGAVNKDGYKAKEKNCDGDIF